MKNKLTKFERIKKLRIDKGLTQEQIAEVLNVKKTTYSRYEIGSLKCPLKILIKLADFYDTSVDYIVDITDTPIPHKQK